MLGKYASVDVGTNTILLLIGEMDENGEIITIRDEHKLARLGENMGETGWISRKAEDRAVKVLENYRDICAQYNVEKIKAVGTSALREAENKDEIRAKLEKALGAEITPITGIDEANYSFIGSVEDDEPSVVLDIGGGSTEMISGSSEKPENVLSMYVGAVNLTDKFLRGHPPSYRQLEEAIAFVDKKLVEAEGKVYSGKFYAVAGTPTTIAAVSIGLKDFQRDKLHGHILTMEALEEVIDIFINSTVDEIINKYGVHPLRADVITGGSLILLQSMKYLNKTACTVSTHGLRYGLLKKLIKESE